MKIEIKNQPNEREIWIKIRGMKTILDMAKDDAIRDFAEKYCQNLYENSRNTFNQSVDLLGVLGMGGLWRGHAIATMMVAESFKNNSKFLSDKK